MIHSVFAQTPINMGRMNVSENDHVLDLRVPEKQRRFQKSSVDYSSIYPSPRASPVHDKSSEEFRSYADSFTDAKIETVQNANLCSSNHILPECQSPNSMVSSSETFNVCAKTMAKSTRPFKTLTKDPFLSIKTAVNLLQEDVDYATFREKMLSQTQLDYNNTNMNMRRKTIHNENNNDPTYWEKRKKNNEAAKKSRDARKAREDEIAIRCAYLEQENLKLKFKIAAAQSDTERLQQLIYRL